RVAGEGGGACTARARGLHRQYDDDPDWAGAARTAEHPASDAPPDVVDAWHAVRLCGALPNIRPQVVRLSRSELLARPHIDAVVRALDGGVPLDLRSLSVAALYAAIHRAGPKVVLTGEGTHGRPR